MEKIFYNTKSITDKLFKTDTELLPSVTELFELEMANMEYELLNGSELIERSAYFKKVGDKPTNHFLMNSRKTEAVSINRSAMTKSYFENGQFSTGYATHSLFPYRGKFHPQLIKGLINIIGIKEGETVLDPMCGSGTANIEASLMGINSFAIDVSPFCQFMTKTKFEALTIKEDFLEKLQDKSRELFNFFNVENTEFRLDRINDNEKLKVYNLAFLAFLDSMGYSKRVTSSNHTELFDKVLQRYIQTVKDIIRNPYLLNNGLGITKVLPESTALNLILEDNSVDGVITSPPYSFAIDYAKNDQDQLEYLGYEVEELKSQMVGLRGQNKKERLDNYFQDMERVCSEVHRVLKKDKYFIMIIGSNTNQTGGIGLEQAIINACEKIRFQLVKSILKPIKGMRNTMAPWTRSQGRM